MSFLDDFQMIIEEQVKAMLLAQMISLEKVAVTLPLPPTERPTMTTINVGEIILNETGGPFPEAREAIKIGMDEAWVSVTFKTAILDPPTAAVNLRLTAEQAIEFGQILLKAAETQPKYAEEAKRLREEQSKLAGKYKDLISGMGLEVLNDRLDDDGSLKVLEPGKSWTV